MAFSNCYRLTSVTIPTSVTAIGRWAFDECSSLKTISVHSANQRYKAIDGVLFTKDGRTLHTYTAGGKTAYRIPNSVTAIGKQAFAECTNLTSVTIPNSVTVIGGSAFSGCRSLTSVTIPDSVTVIGEGAFSWCRSLTSVTIPVGVTIGRATFWDCSSLTSVTIPAGVTAIGKEAFWGCSKLKPEVRAEIERRFGKGVF
jgi:hypothetical protein